MSSQLGQLAQCVLANLRCVKVHLHGHAGLCEPFSPDGIVKVVVIVVVGVVSINGVSVELKVDLMPMKMCAPFIGSNSE